VETKKVSELVALLKGNDMAIRKSAAEELGEIGKVEPESAVPALVDALEDPEVFGTAAYALGEIGEKAKGVVPALIGALKQYYWNAATALIKIGVAAVPALVDALKGQDAEVRKKAAYALGEIGVGHRCGAAVVPALIDALKDKDAEVRGSAAEALGTIGEEAKAAVPALIDALKDGEKGWANWRGSSRTVSSMAAGALSKIDPEVAKRSSVP